MSLSQRLFRPTLPENMENRSIKSTFFGTKLSFFLCPVNLYDLLRLSWLCPGDSRHHGLLNHKALLSNCMSMDFPLFYSATNDWNSFDSYLQLGGSNKPEHEHMKLNLRSRPFFSRELSLHMVLLLPLVNWPSRTEKGPS